MRIHEFESKVWLPRAREEIFAFFSDATSLDAITPPWLCFRTITPSPIQMRKGALIDHQLRIHGIAIRWRSAIKVWEPPIRFVDEQICGPYRLWIHQHTFEESTGGTLVCDRVRYAAPFDFVVHRCLVRPDIERIFAYRTEKLRELFGTKTSALKGE